MHTCKIYTLQELRKFSANAWIMMRVVTSFSRDGRHGTWDSSHMEDIISVSGMSPSRDMLSQCKSPVHSMVSSLHSYPSVISTITTTYPLTFSIEWAGDLITTLHSSMSFIGPILSTS